MSSYLMWEYLRKQVGRFHQANSEAKMADMKALGFFNATNVRGTDLPYPTGTTVANLTYAITSTVDAGNKLKLHFDATPTAKGGLYDFGDNKTAYTNNGETSHTYGAAGPYSVTFWPEDGSPKATLSVTVSATADQTTPEETAPEETAPAAATKKASA